VSKNLGQNSEKCGTVFQSTVHTCVHKNHHVWTGKKCAGPKSLLTSWFSSLIAFSFYLLMRARRYCFSRGASLFWGKQVCFLDEVLTVCCFLMNNPHWKAVLFSSFLFANITAVAKEAFQLFVWKFWTMFWTKGTFDCHILQFIFWIEKQV